MINYGKQNLDSKDINEVIKVLKTDFITQGNKIREFENIRDPNNKTIIIFL